MLIARRKERAPSAFCPACRANASFIPRVQLMQSDKDGAFVIGFIGECVACHAIVRVEKGIAERYQSPEERKRADREPDKEPDDEERRKRALRFFPDGDMRWK